MLRSSQNEVRRKAEQEEKKRQRREAQVAAQRRLKLKEKEAKRVKEKEEEEREEEEVYQGAFKNAERIVQDLKSDKKRVEKSLSMSKESGLSEQVRGDIHSLTAYPLP